MSPAATYARETVMDELLHEAAANACALLSPMEREVLLAAARGAEDKQIAAGLGCSISTVRTLWQRVYQKTGVTSRRKLIALLWTEAVRRCGGVVF